MVRKEEGEAKISEMESVLSLVFRTLQLNCWKKSRVGGYTRSGLVKEKLVVDFVGEGLWAGSRPFIGTQAPECAGGGVRCALGNFTDVLAAKGSLLNVPVRTREPPKSEVSRLCVQQWFMEWTVAL